MPDFPVPLATKPRMQAPIMTMLVVVMIRSFVLSREGLDIHLFLNSYIDVLN